MIQFSEIPYSENAAVSDRQPVQQASIQIVKTEKHIPKGCFAYEYFFEPETERTLVHVLHNDSVAFELAASLALSRGVGYRVCNIIRYETELSS